MPGSGGARPFDNAIDRKRVYFKLMLPSWKENFLNSAQRIDDATFTYEALVSYMFSQNKTYNNAKQNLDVDGNPTQKRKRNQPIADAGRGHGRNRPNQVQNLKQISNSS